MLDNAMKQTFIKLSNVILVVFVWTSLENLSKSNVTFNSNTKKDWRESLLNLAPLLSKVTFDFDKFSREVHTKTTSMMVESSMNDCLIALSSILRYNICQMESLNCLNSKKTVKVREIRFHSCRFCVDL